MPNQSYKSENAGGLENEPEGDRQFDQTITSTETIVPTLPSLAPSSAIRRAITNPKAATPATLLQLQRLVGNRQVTRLLASSPAPAKNAARPGSAVIQRNFPNDANSQRLAQSRVASGNPNMQLDHSVSQETMNKLATNLNSIQFFVKGKDTPYVNSKQAWATLSGELSTKLGNADSIGQLTSELLNLPQNITPGFQETTGNPGSTFDPQMALNGTETDTTYESDELLEFDNAARDINSLVRFFPKKVDADTYNDRLDTQLAAALTTLATSLANIKGSATPTFDNTLWYDHAGKKVKKVGGDWQNHKPANLGAQKKVYGPLNLAPVNFNWTFNLQHLEQEMSQGKKKRALGYAPDVTVNVNVDIPVSCWQHIYDRHTISHFAGDIQAINTFWKLDPFTTIDQAMLQPEIDLLIKRKFDLLKVYDDAEDVSENINEPVTRLFFQGNLDVTPDTTNPALDIQIALKSIAPQHKDLGDAIEPSILA